jgi:glycosyltransferase involved in cell wall biosynthesis
MTRPQPPSASASGIRHLRETPAAAAASAEAFEAFRREHGEPAVAPLAVVIPAFNEEDNIGRVVDEVPATVANLPVTVIVVDDGSADDTGRVAAEHGATVVRLASNCGQGTASRLGYRVARAGGARYIATLDGDGQWDPSDLPAMVQLLEADQADFVLGSRVLGRTEVNDQIRNTGVRVFGWLVRRLTGTTITDTSSGLRAMRAEVTATVPQVQAQYQSSELLIGAALQGYRLAEVPTVMRRRWSGQSKKGRNTWYGLRYASVVMSTWWRVRRQPRAVTPSGT